jgi:hypothetical protein
MWNEVLNGTMAIGVVDIWTGDDFGILQSASKGQSCWLKFSGELSQR